jgi:DNA-binding response OmpR family regulator
MARILVVDDDHMIHDLLHATLSFGGHEIAVAEDGEAALAALSPNPPDVIVLDLDLPGESGSEILARLRARGTRAPVIVLTASGRGREASLRSAGATGYVTKPFSPVALITEIEGALARA